MSGDQECKSAKRREKTFPNTERGERKVKLAMADKNNRQNEVIRHTFGYKRMSSIRSKPNGVYTHEIWCRSGADPGNLFGGGPIPEFLHILKTYGNLALITVK